MQIFIRSESKEMSLLQNALETNSGNDRAIVILSNSGRVLVPLFCFIDVQPNRFYLSYPKVPWTHARPFGHICGAF